LKKRDDDEYGIWEQGPYEEYGICVPEPYGADLYGASVQYVQYKGTTLLYPFLRKNLKSLIKRQNMKIKQSDQSCEKANGLMDMFVVVLNDVIKLCITDVFDSAVTRRFQQKRKIHKSK
jgi:hypothetical protein